MLCATSRPGLGRYTAGNRRWERTRSPRWRGPGTLAGGLLRDLRDRHKRDQAGSALSAVSGLPRNEPTPLETPASSSSGSIQRGNAPRPRGASAVLADASARADNLIEVTGSSAGIATVVRGCAGAAGCVPRGMETRLPATALLVERLADVRAAMAHRFGRSLKRGSGQSGDGSSEIRAQISRGINRGTKSRLGMGGTVLYPRTREVPEICRHFVAKFESRADDRRALKPRTLGRRRASRLSPPWTTTQSSGCS